VGQTPEQTAIDAEIVSRFEGSRQCETMSLREACVLSEELARRLADVEPRPEVVLGIANGGLLVADIVAKALSLPLKSIKIQRHGSGVKKLLTRVPGARRILAWFYDHSILRRPMAWMLLRAERLKPPTELPRPGDGAFQGKVVVLVDDCIESGQTIAVARDMMVRSGAREVLVACLSWTPLAVDLPQRKLVAGVAPDVHVSPVVHIYPWSTSSPHWAGFLRELKDRGHVML
jgi:hypoxanthine phosphoribosyltransferase